MLQQSNTREKGELQARVSTDRQFVKLVGGWISRKELAAQVAQDELASEPVFAVLAR